MSFFGATFEEIGEVRKHPNANMLELAKLKNVDFQFVVRKDECEVGMKVIYIPIDSVLPEKVLEKFGLQGKLAGKDKNRLKTVKLRGEISQGLIVPIADNSNILKMTSEELTVHLGITKYDPPPISCQAGRLIPLSSSQVYDIEGAERNSHIIDLMMNEQVWISEKIEGSNWSVEKREYMSFITKKVFERFDQYSCIKDDKWYLDLKEELQNEMP